MSCKRFVVGLAAAAFLIGSPAWAAGVQHRCEQEARGPENSSVSVAFYVDEAGPITRMVSNWTPPAALAAGENALVGLLYNHSTEAGIGYSTSSIAVISLTRVVDLAGATVTAQVGDRSWTTRAYGEPSARTGGMFVTAVLGRFEEEAPEQPGQAPFRAFNADLLPALDVASTVTITLRDGAGQVLVSRTFDLSGKTQRDRLFQQAWRKVEDTARSPRRCPVAD